MLDQSVQYLKGIGPHRTKTLARIGIETFRDLLNYFPREYEDRRQVSKTAFIHHGEKVVIRGKVELAEIQKLNAKLSAFKVALRDETGIVYGVFIRSSNPYHKHDIFGKLKTDFTRGNNVFIYGECDINFGNKQIKIEEYEVIENSKELIHFNRIVPIYPLTEGINQKWLREIIKSAVDNHSHLWPELYSSVDTIPANDAIKTIHNPKDIRDAEAARQRLAFDEFLLLETALALVKQKTKEISKPQRYAIKRNLLTPFKNKLGFDFTPEQAKVIKEIFLDLQNPKPMNRLLLGDVGSGKTVVALSSMLLAVENNYQAVLVAPTEILAEQHYLTIQRVLSGLQVKIALLTGRLSGKKKAKQKLTDSIASGEIDIAIGTHALLQKGIKFKKLGLAVIDEQHRFGVMQRGMLQQKGVLPDILVMTATPIPRTLALTLYGDLDISTITKLPPGRQPVKTYHLSEERAYDMVKQEIKKGRQAYIVYPLVEESDKIELKAAAEEAGNLSITQFKDMRVGLLHGQMPAAQKDKIMTDFRSREFDILISTTVIEVGIDVPNATIMVIEHADRFGLATLHQLRGRVGRGKEQSFCLLLGYPRTDEAKRRINTMVSTSDGFRIAEEDLAIRGPGEFFGTAQHGIPALKAGNIIKDIKIIEKARNTAKDIIQNDPHLSKSDNSILRTELIRSYEGRFGLSKIG